ncbi:hypothetical protein Xets_02393 [Xenorhabdus sp. TS4]|nr:hypothetical protein [Xenorhabdus sp. TS4]
MFLQWVKRAFIWVIKGIFKEIRGFIAAMFVLFTFIGGFSLKFEFMLLFSVLIAVLYSPEIWWFLKARINNKNRR